jgi:hypothetical protein
MVSPFPLEALAQQRPHRLARHPIAQQEQLRRPAPLWPSVTAVSTLVPDCPPWALGHVLSDVARLAPNRRLDGRDGWSISLQSPFTLGRTGLLPGWSAHAVLVSQRRRIRRRFRVRLEVRQTAPLAVEATVRAASRRVHRWRARHCRAYLAAVHAVLDDLAARLGEIARAESPPPVRPAGAGGGRAVGRPRTSAAAMTALAATALARRGEGSGSPMPARSRLSP